MEIVEILHPIDCWYNFLIGIGGFGKVYSSSMFLYVLVQITTKILNLKLSFWNSFFKLVFSCVEKSTQIMWCPRQENDFEPVHLSTLMAQFDYSEFSGANHQKS